MPSPGADWPTGPLTAGVDLEPLLDEVFDPAGPYHETFAVVAVQGGRIVAERYANRLPSFAGDGAVVDADTPLLSWSMAKSMLHALVGILVGDGRIALADRAEVPEWADPSDPRHAITVEHLLTMRDGLAWREVYSVDAPSDVVTMLFGEGRPDVAHFAADRPLAHDPGTTYNLAILFDVPADALRCFAVTLAEPDGLALLVGRHEQDAPPAVRVVNDGCHV